MKTIIEINWNDTDEIERDGNPLAYHLRHIVELIDNGFREGEVVYDGGRVGWWTVKTADGEETGE